MNITKEILKNIVTDYLNRAFGENFKVAVKREQGFYKIGFRLREEHVELFLSRLSAVLSTLWKNVK